MDIQQALTEEAEYVARTLQGGASALEAELRDIEKRKAEIDAKLHAARRSQKRLLNYQPRIGRDFQCPRCWVRDEVRTTLSPVPGTDEHDIMRCHNMRRRMGGPAQIKIQPETLSAGATGAPAVLHHGGPERRRCGGPSLAGCIRTLSRRASRSVIGRRCFLRRSPNASSARSCKSLAFIEAQLIQRVPARGVEFNASADW
jgi:hypothetical protein